MIIHLMPPTAHVDGFARDHLPPPAQWPEFLFELPELQFPERLNCAGLILDRQALGVHGSRPAIVTPGETWTYRELLSQANRIAHLLVEDMGLVPGNRVLLRSPNNPMLAACWFATLKAGAGPGGGGRSAKGRGRNPGCCAAGAIPAPPPRVRSSARRAASPWRSTM